MSWEKDRRMTDEETLAWLAELKQFADTGMYYGRQIEHLNFERLPPMSQEDQATAERQEAEAAEEASAVDAVEELLGVRQLGLDAAAVPVDVPAGLLPQLVDILNDDTICDIDVPSVPVPALAQTPELPIGAPEPWDRSRALGMVREVVQRVRTAWEAILEPARPTLGGPIQAAIDERIKTAIDSEDYAVLSQALEAYLMLARRRGLNV